MYQIFWLVYIFPIFQIMIIWEWYNAITRHIFHTNSSYFVKNTQEVKFHLAYMRIPHIGKIPRNLLHFALNSNSSHFVTDICDDKVPVLHMW